MQSTTLSSLPQSIQHSLFTKKITKLTPIQSQTISPILEGKSLIAQAKTGSGKTLAFAIPLVMKIKPNNTNPKILILTPTRELSQQIVQVFRYLSKDIPNLKIVSIIGGKPLRTQVTSMCHGVDIIVATPGRLMDHLFRETLSLKEITTVVLDEGDKMIDMGFYDDIDSILKHTPKQAQVLLFSATFSQKLENLTKTFLKGAQSIKTDTVHHEDKITIYGITSNNTSESLLQALWQYKPNKAIVFCNTKDECNLLQETLKNNKISSGVLHGGLLQHERQEALLKLANGSTRILIATDLAARGLDVDNIDIIISFGLPPNKETFTHRIGRAARGDNKDGIALLIYPPHKVSQALELAPKLKSINLHASAQTPLLTKLQTLAINGGRKEKISAKDILGALTKDVNIPFGAIGKIDIFQDYSYVAINKEMIKKAHLGLSNGKIKGRKFKVSII